MHISAAAEQARALMMEGEAGAAGEQWEGADQQLPADHALLAMDLEDRTAFLQVGVRNTVSPQHCLILQCFETKVKQMHL